MTNFVGQNLMEVETMQDQILKEITVEIKDNKDKKVGELVLRGIWVWSETQMTKNLIETLEKEKIKSASEAKGYNEVIIYTTNFLNKLQRIA